MTAANTDPLILAWGATGVLIWVVLSFGFGFADTSSRTERVVLHGILLTLLVTGWPLVLYLFAKTRLR